MNPKPASIARSAATIGGTTLVSRLLGFLRDVMMAAALGAGPIADAFFVAFRFPNMFRSIFAEGASQRGLRAAFLKAPRRRGQEAARRFAEDALSVLLVALLLLTIAAEIAMPWIMLVFAPGFAEDPQKFAWAVEFTRIAFPYLLFISLTALQSAILNSLGRFFPGAAAPVMLNVTLIIAILFLVPLTDNPGTALSWGVAAAGVVQFVWLAVSLWRAGFVLRLRLPKLTPDVRRLFRLGVPGVVAVRHHAGQPHHRHHHRLAAGGRRVVALLCRPDLSTAAGRHRHRDRRRAAAGSLAPPARRLTGRARSAHRTVPSNSRCS